MPCCSTCREISSRSADEQVTAIATSACVTMIVAISRVQGLTHFMGICSLCMDIAGGSLRAEGRWHCISAGLQGWPSAPNFSRNEQLLWLFVVVLVIWSKPVQQMKRTASPLHSDPTCRVGRSAYTQTKGCLEQHVAANGEGHLKYTRSTILQGSAEMRCLQW